MKISLRSIIISAMGIIAMNAYAEPLTTKRTPQFSNDRVNVWETIIYPEKNQKLKMHRHEFDRVLIALSDGKLKIVSDKGQVHYLKLNKGHSYYLKKDKINELHSDENTGINPIKVIVVELK